MLRSKKTAGGKFSEFNLQSRAGPSYWQTYEGWWMGRSQGLLMLISFGEMRQNMPRNRAYSCIVLTRLDFCLQKEIRFCHLVQKFVEIGPSAWNTETFRRKHIASTSRYWDRTRTIQKITWSINRCSWKFNFCTAKKIFRRANLYYRTEENLYYQHFRPGANI